MPRRIPDTSKIERTIGWEPTRTLDEIIADVVAVSVRPAAPGRRGHRLELIRLISGKRQRELLGRPCRGHGRPVLGARPRWANGG